MITIAIPTYRRGAIVVDGRHDFLPRQLFLVFKPE